jgi:hypothetical protein
MCATPDHYTKILEGSEVGGTMAGEKDSGEGNDTWINVKPE